MGLVRSETIRRRISDFECILSGKLLLPGETLVSRDQFPQLYALTPWDRRSLDILRELVETILDLKSSDDVGTFNSRQHVRMAKPFMQLLLSQKDLVPEYCVHAFIYLYWDEVKYSGAPFPPEGKIYFNSAALNSAVQRNDPYYRLLGRLKEVANVDLIAISEERQHIFLIEVKRGTLDDRAIGQVLRYFNESSKLLTDRIVREFNISYVRPILVLNEVPRAYFEAFPVHFREFLDIYQYETEKDASDGLNVVLSNVRRRMLTAAMQ